MLCSLSTFDWSVSSTVVRLRVVRVHREVNQEDHSARLDPKAWRNYTQRCTIHCTTSEYHNWRENQETCNGNTSTANSQPNGDVASVRIEDETNDWSCSTHFSNSRPTRTIERNHRVIVWLDQWSFREQEMNEQRENDWIKVTTLRAEHWHRTALVGVHRSSMTYLE